ncbi:hypothetical protein PhCBS80983_g03639 [Powellomyces hirtus]|uniref:Uncharacterized protein n=1 Tax=Powellomyces hirtus TaxID=109895 RepID=A0A507E3K6_9FUNG|nr:hypothetical protein PhCBS80983_g03639 [Powellomyces hirtus]
MLRTKIFSTFDKALSSGAVVWSDSTAHHTFAAGVNFQIRLAASLGKKPTADRPHNDQSAATEAPNPFLPYDPALFIEKFDKHNLLLNKFSIVRGHVLLTTKEFQSQLDPLNASDLEEAWKVMLAPGMLRYLSFYNCGPNSGASQPHKHLQLIPESDDDQDQPFPPTEAIFIPESDSKERTGIAFAHEAFPFAHAVTILPPIPADPTAAGVLLETLYKQALTKAFELASLNPGQCLNPSDDRSSQPSYNFILTRTFMIVVPRLAEKAQGISLNSVAFAGMMLVKSAEQLVFVKEKGPLQLLQEVAYPIHTHNQIFQ